LNHLICYHRSFAVQFPTDLGWGTKNLFKQSIRPVSEFNPDVNKALDRIIAKALNGASDVFRMLSSFSPH
jgi:hypothetical protein